MIHFVFYRPHYLWYMGIEGAEILWLEREKRGNLRWDDTWAEFYGWWTFTDLHKPHLYSQLLTKELDYFLSNFFCSSLMTFLSSKMCPFTLWLYHLFRISQIISCFIKYLCFYLWSLVLGIFCSLGIGLWMAKQDLPGSVLLSYTSIFSL